MQLGLVNEVFELFDTDGQHELDEDELASAVYALGFSQEDYTVVSFNDCHYELAWLSLVGLAVCEGLKSFLNETAVVTVLNIL